MPGPAQPKHPPSPTLPPDPLSKKQKTVSNLNSQTLVSASAPTRPPSCSAPLKLHGHISSPPRRSPSPILHSFASTQQSALPAAVKVFGFLCRLLLSPLLKLPLARSLPTPTVAWNRTTATPHHRHCRSTVSQYSCAGRLDLVAFCFR